MSDTVSHWFSGTAVLCDMCGKNIQSHFPNRKAPAKINKRGGFFNPRNTFCGIDGEGQGRKPHKYVLLAASDEKGKQWSVYNPNGLDTRTCLDFILELPANRQLFSYGFNYDLTKILEDVDNRTLYLLNRPELRRRIGVKGAQSICWRGYMLNLQGTRFTVAKEGKKRVVWDVLKFYQTTFVKALKAWEVGEPNDLDFMEFMKSHRAEFDTISIDQITAYCLSECVYLSKLVRKLHNAHKEAGIQLRAFYGAGSTSSAILDSMKIKEKIIDPPVEVFPAIASAFFGGRFENSRIGIVNDPVFSFDIASAYPYQLFSLPCQLHGEWRKVTSREELDGRNIRTALVRWSVESIHMNSPWSPFPFREPNGAICYPSSCDGGWVWLDEYLAGEELFPNNVRFHKAWVYDCDCNCRPFEMIPHFYRERMRIGKKGAGIVFKLGPNGAYGKLAQSVGDPPFNSWWWAGMVTSGCRAQLLRLMAKVQDLSSILMVATDGLYSLEDIEDLPLPIDTGTLETGNPLGSWERTPIRGGTFYARPGIYFPLNPTEEEKEKIRARGLGRSVVNDNWATIVEGYKRGYPKITVEKVSRFCGMKSSISRSGRGKRSRFKRANAQDGIHPCYGQWVEREVELTFNPHPKRQQPLEDGTLPLRKMPRGLVSTPYRKALTSWERKEYAEKQLERMEQPDFDWIRYEDELTSWGFEYME